MVKEKKKDSKKKSTKKVCETFEVTKDGKKKVIEKCGEIQEEKIKKGQIQSENKQLKILLITCAIILIAFIGTYVYSVSLTSFDYKGTKFLIVDEIAPYNTKFPAYDGETGELIGDYNIYFRNDPRKLDSIPFEGRINLKRLVVLNMENESALKCNDGDDILAVGELIALYKSAWKYDVVTDPNATCDDQGRYMYVNIKTSDTTSIEQTGTSCYEINVNNCEILEAVEKFLVESVVEFNS